MSLNTLKQAAGTDTALKKPQTALEILQAPSFKKQLALALPKHITPDRMARVCMTMIRQVPLLMKCDPMSLIGSIVKLSQLGLEPDNGLGHAYLIPFKNNKKNTVECQLIIGYRGMICIGSA